LVILITRLLLKVTGTADTPSTEAVARAIDAMSGTRLANGWFELADGDTDGPLRLLNRACSVEGVTAIVLAKAAEPTPRNAPYEPLSDRTEELAGSLDAWRNGAAPFPELKPWHLVRLPV